MSEPVEHAREFICMDCGSTVTVFMPLAANEQDICIECTFIRSIEDPMERQKIRDFLKPKQK
jgi:hypothetical protein